MRSAPERWVLALGLAGGLLLVFATPPFEVPDEPAHFFRIYQVAAGAAVEQGPGGGAGIRVPASLPRLVDLCLGDVPFHPERRVQPGMMSAAWHLPLAPGATVFLPYGRLSPYTAEPYLAAVPAVALGRLLAVRPLALLFLARLCNLAAAVALSWAAVRLAPDYRWVFALVALTPMAMFERSSASADAVTNALALLLVSLVLRLALRAVPAAPSLDPAPGAAPASASALPPAPAAAPAHRAAGPSGLLIGLLLGAAFLLAAAKAVYFLLDLLIFLVPAAHLGGRRRTLAVRAGALAATAAGIGVSWWVAHSYFGFGSLRAGVQPLQQLRGVLAAPAHFVALAVADYARHALRYSAGLVGTFGWMDAPLPRPAIGIWAGALVAVTLTGGAPAIRLAPWQRLLTAAVVAATLLALSLSQYLAWTPLGAAGIEGLQGRYFLPLLPAGTLLLYNRRWAGRWPAGAGDGLRLGALCVAFTLLTLACLWFRYHGAAGAAGAP
jgi:hypothetical protein